uniref:Vesicle-associated membrane protein 7 n=1 Tax=Strigamia maritima TaxID=126957 RepID=T1JHJ7_STRMM
MTIVFSCISNGAVIVVSHQNGQGMFEIITENVLKNIPLNQNTKATVAADNYLVHVVADNGLIYSCIADSEFGRRIPYAYLHQIRSRFTQSSLASRAITACYRELDRDFEFVLEQEMVKFSKGETGDTFSKLKAQVNDVKGIMLQNVEKVMERGENLDTLLSRTADLESSADLFSSHSRKLHRKMKWKNMKMWIIIILIVTIILTLIILYATGVLTPKD